MESETSQRSLRQDPSNLEAYQTRKFSRDLASDFLQLNDEHDGAVKLPAPYAPYKAHCHNIWNPMFEVRVILR